MPRAPQKQSPARRARPPRGEECILVLQGGGALGAYQAGVFEALHAATPRARLGRRHLDRRHQCRADRRQSAGATRVERLREFWELVSAPGLAAPTRCCAGPDRGAAQPRQRGAGTAVRRAGLLHAALAAGRRSSRAGSSAAISYYDTAPLRATLERLVDFDRINDGAGAAVGRRGQRAHRQLRLLRHRQRAPRRAPRHGQRRAAAGLCAGRDRRRALLGRRPGLEHAAAIRARPAGHAARAWCSRSTCSRRAANCRATLAEVGEREKDIRFSSRTRMNTTVELAAAGDRAGGTTPARQAAARAARRPRRAGAGGAALRGRGRRRAPDLPQQALREPVEGLRVLAPVDAGALGRRQGRHGPDAARPALARPPAQRQRRPRLRPRRVDRPRTAPP